MSISRLFTALAGALVIAATARAQQQQGATSPLPAFNRANLDTTCAPCQDFYEFANGGWMAHDSIGPAYASWSAFNEVADRNLATLHAIMDDATAHVRSAKRGSNVWKVGTFYAACMDTATIERLGTQPLAPLMSIIASWRTGTDVARSFGKLEYLDGLSPYWTGIIPDPKHSSQTIVVAAQSGLGLPDRDYYLRSDARTEQIRQAYTTYLRTLFILDGESAARADSDAAHVLALETRLATASMSRVERRDPQATYHKLTLAALDSLTPHLAWAQFFHDMGSPPVHDVDVQQPVFFQTMDTLITTVPVATWQAYMRSRVLRTAATTLSQAFRDAAFTYRRALTGQEKEFPRWRQCTNATSGAMGEAVGQLFVARTFTPQAKARALHMVNNLRAALRARIQTLSWMSDSTKAQALAKLDAMTQKIGYPDKWRDYSTLVVRPGEYAANVMFATQFSNRHEWGKLDKPVDRNEWQMTPPTVNAYYQPLYNEIVFPAGILQPPFFNPNADDAINYGAIGAVIGHEMSHAFDDQGRQYDKNGNLRDWWTAADAKRFQTQADRVVQQFDSYTVLDSSSHVNGKLTLGEDIGDLGGVTIAYAALERDLAKHGRPGLIDGFTPEQRFFLGWAQVWRQLMRPQTQRMRLKVDVHAPAKWRVDGPLSNMPEFKAAWGCHEGDTMVRPDSLRARIW